MEPEESLINTSIGSKRLLSDAGGVDVADDGSDGKNKSKLVEQARLIMIIIDYPYLLDHLHPQLSVFDINDGDVLTRMNYKELENFLIHQASKRIKPTYEEAELRSTLELARNENTKFFLQIYLKPFEDHESTLLDGRSNIEKILDDLIIQTQLMLCLHCHYDAIIKVVLNVLNPVYIESTLHHAKAFEAEYEFPDRNLDHYETFVRREVIEEFKLNRSRYHSLYFTVVQSDGYGKSRMIIEAGKTRLHTLYACLCSEFSTQFPVSNNNVKTMIRICDSEEDFMFFLAIVYMTALELLGCGEIADGCAPKPGYPLQLLVTPDENDPCAPKFAGFWDRVYTCFNQWFKDETARSKLIKSAQFYHTNYWRCKKNDDVPSGYAKSDTHYMPEELILAFDEGKYFIDISTNFFKFRKLRNAHRKMKSSHFVLVFVDTSFTISKFSLPYDQFPRDSLANEFRLLPAFTSVLTYNATCIKAKDPNDSVQNLVELFSKGRPLWATCVLSKPDLTIEDISHAIKFAMRKLSNEPMLNMKGSFFATLATMSIRFGLRGIMDHSYATELVEKHMATVLHYGEDRLRMFAHYVPEPILSEAACRLLHGFKEEMLITGDKQYPSEILLEGLKTFVKCILSGFIDVGTIGEAILRIVISLVHDNIQLSTDRNGPIMTFSEPIEFSKFMDALIPTDYKEMYQDAFESPCYNPNDPMITKMRKEGFVCFTTFEVLEYDNNFKLTQTVLKKAFDHRFAIIGPENREGFSLIIPVKINDHFAATIIHLKSSCERLDRFSASGTNLTPRACFQTHDLGCYMSIYVELCFSGKLKESSEKNRVRAAAHYQNYGNHAVLLDLSSIDCLHKSIVARLSAIQSQRVDYVNKNGKISKLKFMNPHRYYCYRSKPLEIVDADISSTDISAAASNAFPGSQSN